jgi:hypothetical protein
MLLEGLAGVAMHRQGAWPLQLWPMNCWGAWLIGLAVWLECGPGRGPGLVYLADLILVCSMLLRGATWRL